MTTTNPAPAPAVGASVFVGRMADKSPFLYGRGTVVALHGWFAEVRVDSAVRKTSDRFQAVPPLLVSARLVDISVA